MKNRLILLGIIFSVLYTNAQNLNYDLRSYKLSEIERRQLDLSFYLGGNQVSQVNPSSFYVGSAPDYKGFNLSNNTTLVYSSFGNYFDEQKELNVSFDQTMNYSKSNNEENYEYKETIFTPSLNVTSVNRKFFNGQTFIEVNYGGSISTLLYSTEQKTSWSDVSDAFGDSDESKSTMNNVILNLPVKVGQGRIEEVQDARQALYILNVLKQKRIINKEISSEDVTKFADLIAGLQRKRFFDYRNQKEKELIEADKFLKGNGLIDKNDIRYFVALNDYWDYGSQQIRKSGTSFAFAIYPSIGYLNSKEEDTSISGTYKSSDEFESNVSMYSLNTGLEFINEIPVSVALQSSANCRLLYGIMGFKEKGAKSADKVNNLQLDVGYTLGFYPNTRTSIEYSLRGRYLKPLSIDDQEYSSKFQEDIAIEAISGFKMNYYISPQLSIRAYYNIVFDWADSERIGFIPSDYDKMEIDYVISTFRNEFQNQYYYYNQADRIVNHNFGLSLVYKIF